MNLTKTIKWPVGVCVLPDPPANLARTAAQKDYVHEILGHAGLCYSAIPIEALPQSLPELRVLVTVGDTELDQDLSVRLRDWVEAGGTWIAVAGVCGMPDLFGVEVEQPSFGMWNRGAGTLGEGYLEPLDKSHSVLSHLSIPLHFFNGLPAHVTRAKELAGVLDAHQRQTRRAAVTAMELGRGCCTLIAPDVIGAVVRIQQGTCVTRDGVPSSDGCGSVSDGVLKSDDGAVLDWIFDREPVPGVTGLSAFLQPIADQWRELLLRAILCACERAHVTLPILWLYPRNLPALAQMSSDTDGNEEPKALLLLDKMKEAGVASTWCVLPPGYPQSVNDAIRGAGHELGMHYDATSEGCGWGEDEFDSAYEQVVAALGGLKPVTNKNHFLRWEGDTEFFDWMARRGIRFDQSKGSTKTGEAGFNFGTCHPYFPACPDGRLIDVLELPTYTQDIGVFAPMELVDPLLGAALRHHGIAHFLFHPAHVDRPGVAQAMREVVEAGKRNGMEWWTAQQINDWERARRSVSWADYKQEEDSLRISLSSLCRLPDATVMLLGPRPTRWLVNGEESFVQSVKRWGFKFYTVTLTIENAVEYVCEADWRRDGDES